MRELDFPGVFDGDDFGNGGDEKRRRVHGGCFSGCGSAGDNQALFVFNGEPEVSHEFSTVGV